MAGRDLTQGLEELTAHWEGALRRAFLDAVALLRDTASVARITAALEGGDVAAALREVYLEPLAMRGLEDALASAYAAGGASLAAQLPSAARGPLGHKLLVLFDARNPRAEAWIREHSAELVRAITEDQRRAVRAHLEAAVTNGVNPRQAALDLVGRTNPTTGKREGGVIGLTATQEAWCRNYAEELALASPGALQRNLRDRRFDAAVRRAVEAGQPLSPAQRARMVAAYRARALRHRAEGLARTEAMTALNHSQEEAARQAVERGQVRPEYVTKTWHSARDLRVRDTHSAMHGQRVPLAGRFTSPSGVTLAYPGDPTAPGSERVNCRCSMRVRVDFARMLADSEVEAA